jgi:predicted molibdopterin-dependent oxidoreductase YjgC
MAQTQSLNLNGKSVAVTIDDPDMPLLYALRDNLGLHGPRFGCGLEQCGACTVHVDGKAVRSCVTPLSSLKVPASRPPRSCRRRSPTRCTTPSACGCARCPTRPTR